jgi:hypothetical protein
LIKKNGKNNNMSIKVSTINHPRFDAVVAATVVETYLQHADPAPDPILLQHIGRILEVIRNINNIEMEMAVNGNDVIRTNVSNDLSAELTDLVVILPVPDELSAINLAPHPPRGCGGSDGDVVAQLAKATGRHQTANAVVPGSNPAALTVS